MKIAPAGPAALASSPLKRKPRKKTSSMRGAATIRASHIVQSEVLVGRPGRAFAAGAGVSHELGEDFFPCDEQNERSCPGEDRLKADWSDAEILAGRQFAFLLYDRENQGAFHWRVDEGEAGPFRDRRKRDPHPVEQTRHGEDHKAPDQRREKTQRRRRARREGDQGHVVTHSGGAPRSFGWRRNASTLPIPPRRPHGRAGPAPPPRVAG